MILFRNIITENSTDGGIGDFTNIGVIDDMTDSQFQIGGRWYAKRIVNIVNKLSDSQIIINTINILEKERGKGYITLYHGTDNKSYDSIIKSGKIGIGDGVTFFTNKRSEATEYAINKSKYRNIEGKGKVLEVVIPKWAIKRNRATGEYETEFELKELNGKYIPTDESILKITNKQ